MADTPHLAFSVTNIKTHISVTLDFEESNYQYWTTLFLVLLGRFALDDHLDSTKAPPSTDPSYTSWKQLDYLILSWIYSTISKDLFKQVLKKDTTTAAVWKSLNDLFTSNKETRALQLEDKFRLQKKGTLSIHEYCSLMKDLADQLGDVDHQISDKSLILTILRGLPSDYDTQKSTIPLQKPFPSFLETENILHAREITLKEQEIQSIIPATALNATTTTPSAAPSRPLCSYCHKYGHSHDVCYSLHGYPPSRGGRSSRSGRRGGYRGGYHHQPHYPQPAVYTPPRNSLPPPTRQFSQPPTAFRAATNRSGLLGPRPTFGLSTFIPSHQVSQDANSFRQLHSTGSNSLSPHVPFNNPMTQQGLINQFDNLALQVPNDTWYMDSGASSHMASNAGILHTSFNFSNYAHPDIVVGNGSTLPVSQIGNSQLPSHPNLKLNNILISPPLVKNLISVRQFTKDNNCSIEFDPYGFSVKNLTSQVEIFRCNSHGDLYPVTNLKNHSSLLAYPSTSTLWHRRLGHPGSHAFQFLVSNKFIDCNRNSSLDICDACQLGKHVKLPFNNYSSPTFAPFDIIHADLWTSPIYSVTSYKYYLVLLDNFTHYSWVYPLRHKSEVYAKFQDFHALIKTQFNSQIKAFQCDHGREFDNQSFEKFFASLGITFRFPCPHTSQQNGKAERIIRTLNNISRTLLFQARLPPSFWVESLYMANHLLNLTPTTTINYMTPYEKLFHSPPTYSHLRVFGCLCYPNTSATMPHKLAPRSRRCIFLGFPAYHRGYKCLDLDTGKIIISRHVVFNENCFPYSSAPLDPSTYDFLEPHDSPSPAFHLPTKHLFSPAPTVNNHPTPTPSQATTTNSSSPPPSSHPMVTRRMTGNLKPRILMNLSTSTISPIPHSYKQALKDLNWTKAMQDEYNALIENDTWDLVPCPTNAPIVSGKWLYRHKFNSDGSLERHKARWVVRGFTQTPGVDFDETFSPVVKPATIRTVLSIAVSHSWPIHQMDVKNAFLHGDIKETIYCQQPSGFVDPSHPNHVCRLKKALYGLKQAPRAWYQKFASFITSIGFTSTKSDSSLFVYNKGSHIAYLLLYVDDILLTASSDTLLRDIMTLLSKQFSMKDLGTLNYFLGISATFTNNSLFLTQDKFSQEILKRAGMESCHSVSTPVDTNPKLSANSGSPIPNPTTYRELTGALQYLTFTRPDITYAVQQLCLFMHDPREHHWQALKHVLRYIKGTSSYGLWIHPSSTDRLVAYSDADWAGCPDSRRSTSGFCIFLGENLVSWSSKRQTTVSRSSAEAEYRSVANTAAECCWLRNLLTELLCPVSQASIIFCDNISAVYLSGNPVQHHRTKHIEIDIHFVRDLVSINQIRVLHVPSSSQFADIFTKGLPSSLFRQFRSSLSIRLPPASTDRAC